MGLIKPQWCVTLSKFTCTSVVQTGGWAIAKLGLLVFSNTKTVKNYVVFQILSLIGIKRIFKRFGFLCKVDNSRVDLLPNECWAVSYGFLPLCPVESAWQ